MNKAIFIDTSCQNISEVTIESSQEAISEKLSCKSFDKLNIDWSHDLLIPEQEDAMTQVTPASNFFKFKNSCFYCGNGLIMNGDGEGGAIDTTIEINAIKDKIEFYTLPQVKKIFML